MITFNINQRKYNNKIIILQKVLKDIKKKDNSKKIIITNIDINNNLFIDVMWNKYKIWKLLNKYYLMWNKQEIYDAIIWAITYDVEMTKDEELVQEIYNSEIKSCITKDPLISETWNKLKHQEKDIKLVYVSYKNNYLGRIIINSVTKERWKVYTIGDKYAYNLLNNLYSDYIVTEKYDLSIIKGEIIAKKVDSDISFNQVREINNLQMLWLLNSLFNK